MTNYLDCFLYSIIGDTMKRVILIIFLFGLACIVIFNNNVAEEERKVNNLEKRGVFVSYIDISKYIKNSDVSVSKMNIVKMLDNICNLGFNMVILQVVSFSDAIYKSNIYPWSSIISSSEGVYPGYDVLGYFLEKAHEKDISVYVWINPYRVRTNSNIDSISSYNPAYKYIGSDTLYVNKGIYFNPAKEEVEDLIVEGVEELISNYKVDGVLFDDYFYPDRDVSINDYEAYLEKNKNISFSEYKLMIINRMIERVHRVCSKHNILFGISPDGNIDNNYSNVCADVITWLSSDKYVDFIIPQIYYGFYNGNKPFLETVTEWNNLIKNKNIDMYVALAFYKVGLVDNFAKGGKFEWEVNDNIIMKEILMSRNLKQYRGFVLFRYGYLFDEKLYSITTLKEIENMKKFVK